METPKIKMKRSALAGYVLILASFIGRKLELEVAHNVTERNRVVSESGRESYIVGLKAIAPDKVEAVKELFKDREEVDIEETNGLFLSANIWINDGQPSTSLPMKGEKIDVTIDEVPNRDGEAVLRVTNIKTRQAESAKKLSLDSFFAAASVEATAGELKTA